MLDRTQSTGITLWDGRTIPRLGMGCWAIGEAILCRRCAARLG